MATVQAEHSVIRTTVLTYVVLSRYTVGRQHHVPQSRIRISSSVVHEERVTVRIFSNGRQIWWHSWYFGYMYILMYIQWVLGDNVRTYIRTRTYLCVLHHNTL